MKFHCQTKAPLAAQTVKDQQAMQEILVPFLGREDPLEKEMATHSSIHGQRSLVGYSSWLLFFSTVLQGKSVKMEEDEDEEMSSETSKAQYIYYVAFYMKFCQPL